MNTEKEKINELKKMDIALEANEYLLCTGVIRFGMYLHTKVKIKEKLNALGYDFKETSRKSYDLEEKHDLPNN